MLASLPPEQLAAFLKRTSDRELEAIEHDWGWWGRPNQRGIYEVTRRKAEALVKERLAAVEAGRPKSEPAPGSMEYQALHPEWKPQDGGESY